MVLNVERVMGIEPTQSAWKAGVLPLNYTRRSNSNMMVEGGGFEPPKVEPADLQSDPFGRSGTPPSCNHQIIAVYFITVKLIFNNFDFSPSKPEH